MNKAALLTAAAVLGLSAGGASEAGPAASFSGNAFKATNDAKVLYNQNSNYAGGYVDSQNFTSIYEPYDDQAADDFVVPIGSTWTIREVDVSGAYFDGSAPASSENVIFYKDRKGSPGRLCQKGKFVLSCRRRQQRQLRHHAPRQGPQAARRPLLGIGRRQFRGLGMGREHQAIWV